MEPIHQTKRPTTQALEDIIYKPFKVLDHGFIRLIDYMGNDAAVVQAARISHSNGTKQVTLDQGLINYLMRHDHTSPFEMCEIKFHIKLPIFVARQWIRHRTASVTEYSARYSLLSKEFYLPDPAYLGTQSSSNKQGGADTPVPPEIAEAVLTMLRDNATTCYDQYQYLHMMNQDENTVDEHTVGISGKLARMNLTMNYYTEWYWKINLHNLLRFLRLRADSKAQFELRQYAETILDIVRQWVPMTYNAFVDYKLNGAYISLKGLQVIRDMIQGKTITEEASCMSKGEWKELMKLISPPSASVPKWYKSTTYPGH